MERGGRRPTAAELPVDEIIDVVAGGFNDQGLAIYRAQPSERDANAAATRFARARFAQETIDAVADTDDAVLLTTDMPPETIATLPSRNVKFLFQYADVCTKLAAGFESFAERLADIAPQARDLWLELEHRQAAKPSRPR